MKNNDVYAATSSGLKQKIKLYNSQGSLYGFLIWPAGCNKNIMVC